jgi:arylsulfatase A-like enzyme
MGLQYHLLLLLSGVLSVGQTDATRGNLVPARLAEHDLDLVLITVDALRADRLGTYGYARPTSPHIDALARESIVFERAYCAGPSTAFSIASIMLGRHAWGMAQEAPLVARDSTLADRFARAGYETIALYPPAVYFSAGPEFDPLRKRHFGFARVVYNTPNEDDAVARTDATIRLLREHAGDPVFLWVHYFAPHEPYVLHPSLDFPMGPNPSASERYDGEIAWVDRQIGRLVDHVRATRPGAVIVLTADHGEEFGDHGGAYHGTTLFDEQVRVPLLIAAPSFPARREQRPVSTVDLGAMVESLFDAHSLAARTALSPTLRLPVPESPVFAELGALKAAVVGPYKAICDFWAASCRLYNTDQDPGERLNLAAKKPRTLATMHRLIRAWAGQDPASEARAPWLPSRRETALRRARRGDSTGGPDLLALVTDRSLEVDTRLEAARFLSRVAQPRQRPALRKAWAAADPPVESWLAVTLAGLGDKKAVKRVADMDLASAPAHPEFVVQRAIALAGTGDPQSAGAIAEALARTTNPDFRCRLFAAVAQLPGDEPRQLLLPAYEDVHTRRCVSVALERLGDEQTADFVATKLETEPYATVRAILIRTLARVGGARYREQIKRIWVSDPEPLVTAAARSALRTLGAADTSAKARRRGAGRARL